jgi:uncharacterized protein (TIGR02145 family)
MKTKIFLTVIALFQLLSASGQQADIELKMTAIDNESYISLDSIKVMNLTQEVDTLLVWPDTLLSLSYLGVSELEKKENLFRVLPNYPNPVNDKTIISVYVPNKDNVALVITDVSGRVVLKTDRLLDKGLHTFRFQPANANLYLFTAQWRGNSQSIKILQVDSHNNGACMLEYIGSESSSSPQIKYADYLQEFKFSPGDELLLIGYANDLQSGMLEKPDISGTCTFQFATNIPCPGMPTVEFEGQVYNTIQICSQCWLKENLNVGTMIQANISMTNNDVLEKYCYGNSPYNCTKYGGLYQWNEAMQYTTQQGAQGICPSGWHLPTVEEWIVLFGTVDSQYGIGDPEWYLPPPEFLGYDAGTNLKTIDGWYSNGNGTDLFGFSGMPGSFHNDDGPFGYLGEAGNWWMSLESNNSLAWHLCIGYDKSNIGLANFLPKNYGISVRCLRDE